jgi:mono/diheme cytochrome c family protein
VLFSLSTQHEIGLAVAGALFITFALLSSFVFTRSNPNFPGQKGLRWYLPVCFLFFIGMLSAVLVFGREKPEAEAAGTTTSAQTTTTTPTGPTGDPGAGKAVFASAGCAACHTFKPAGSTGVVGPDLDHLADYAQKAGQSLGDFTLAAITSPPPKYVPPGFQNIMPGTFGQTLTPKQLADLVAFLDAPAGP